MFKKLSIFFTQLLLLAFVLLNRITFYLNMAISWCVTKIYMYKERQYIKRYAVERVVYHPIIDASFTLEEDGSATITIKGQTTHLKKEEVEIFLDMFTKLNEKIVINGDFTVTNN